MTLLKSIGAVLIGFVSVAVLSIGTDVVLAYAGILPSGNNVGSTMVMLLVIALAYRSIYTILGGYITARLAPQNPWNHVYALMVLGGIGGIAGAIDGWSLGNHWYPVLLALTGPVFVWIGGRIAIPKPVV